MDDLGEADIVGGGGAEGDEFVGGGDEIIFRLIDFDGGGEIGGGFDFVFWAELVFEFFIFGNEVDAIIAVGGEGEASGEEFIVGGKNGEGDSGGGFSLFDAEFAAGDGLIGGDFEFDHRALDPGEIAVFFVECDGGNFCVSGRGDGLFESGFLGAGDGGEGVAAGAGVAGLDAIIDGLSGDGDGDGEAIFAEGGHGGDAATFGEVFGFELGGGGDFATEFDDEANDFAVGDGLVAWAGLDDFDLGFGYAVEVGTWEESAEEKGAGIEATEKGEEDDATDDHAGDDQGIFDEGDREEGGHLDLADAGGDISLDERAKLFGVKDIAVGASEFDRGEQVFAEFGFGVFDEAGDLAFVWGVEELFEALPPDDADDGDVGGAAEGPADGVGEEEGVVEEGDDEHRGDEHGGGREDASGDDEEAPAAGESLKFFEDEGVKMGAHNLRKVEWKIGENF